MYVCLIPKYKYIFKIHYPVIIFKDYLLLSKMIIKCINLEYNNQYNNSLRIWNTFWYALTEKKKKNQATKYCRVAPNIFSITIAVPFLTHKNVYQFKCTEQTASDNGEVYIVGLHYWSFFISHHWGKNVWKICAPLTYWNSEKHCLGVCDFKPNFICNKV
jgi:hypothetical protein